MNDSAAALRINLCSTAGSEVGTSANPIRTDPIGTTAQPVSGRITGNDIVFGSQVSLCLVVGAGVLNAAAVHDQYLSQLRSDTIVPFAVDTARRVRAIAHDSDPIGFNVLYWHTGAHVVQATAHAATTRTWALYNADPTLATRIRRVRFQSQMGSVLATPTSPRIALTRFSPTGFLSGVTVTPASKLTAYGPVGNLQLFTSVSTGSITLSANICAFLPIAGATAVGYAPPVITNTEDTFDRPIILLPGEGIVCRQLDNGTASDTRRFITDLVVEEYNPEQGF